MQTGKGDGNDDDRDGGLPRDLPRYFQFHELVQPAHQTYRALEDSGNGTKSDDTHRLTPGHPPRPASTSSNHGRGRLGENKPTFIATEYRVDTAFSIWLAVVNRAPST